MNSVPHIIANIQIIRKERSYSLALVAARAGIAHRTLDNLITGKHNPTVRTVDSIADALGVPPDTLLRPPVK